MSVCERVPGSPILGTKEAKVRPEETEWGEQTVPFQKGKAALTLLPALGPRGRECVTRLACHPAILIMLSCRLSIRRTS